MDNQFTLLLKTWLETPPQQRDYTVGALYLLQLSGNKVMYSNIIANITGRKQFVEYQLQKYYDFRVQALTHAQVEAMAAKVDAIAAEHHLAGDSNNNNNNSAERAKTNTAGDSNNTSESKTPPTEMRTGKRDDHDSLPDEIKACYVENLSILQRMRQVHLKLRSLSLENATCPDSERYPFLKELINLDKRYHENWDKYDHYITPPTPP